MTEQWLVFRDRETGRELCAYTIRGTFPGERRATIELLAVEKGIPEEQIETAIEKRKSTGEAPGKPRERA